MTVVRIGSNKKYAENWENIFGKKRKAKSATTKSTKKAPKKTPKKKSTAKKRK